jgi:hypothetical protein
LPIDREVLLEMAVCHVAEGERRVAAQKVITERLKPYKQASGQAEMMLRLLEDCLESMIAHQHLIETEIVLSREFKRRSAKTDSETKDPSCHGGFGDPHPPHYGWRAPKKCASWGMV